ncbi:MULTISPECIES: DNA internalization-related competence protein ComEC/Rec2 [unclassified Neisseria]|uniref:DNA internalization-related competence protein ComEC/Rec2 n=1 Tax=unclassified Neisseria TaxID=2623750 RepID=UPI0010722076|nr:MULTISPECIES: DNA internalization-related competence protein ComEC/Rec2 [unclassified Neisseria]MBF0804673.1 DNA internalization-related competence protein ComEC/Rec2 [Neisseria sp. 19428wB4_WF04]TFU40309.1 DNA internalization-related competence protein ComEC/Rec2 [Neisseria sp. WF04]
MPKPWLLLWAAGVAASFALPAVPSWTLLAAVWLCLLVPAWRFRAAAWLLLCLSGALYGIWRTQSALDKQWPLFQTAPAALTIEVADLPQRDDQRVRFTAKAVDGGGRQYRLQLADYQLRDWPAGSRWQVQARVRPPVGEANRVGFNREAWALSNGIGGVGTIGKERQALPGGSPPLLLRWREYISRRWQHTDTHGQDFSDGLALMRALGIGEQSALSGQAWQSFRPLGLNHLVSISGLHVGMVAVLAGWLAKCGLRVLPQVPATPRLWVLAAGLSAAVCYAGLAGFAVPTQRSVLMLLALAWAWWRGSGASAWRGWQQALAWVLLFDPTAVLGAGFWLSFGLVGALLWASAGRLNEHGLRVAVRAQWAVTAVSVVALGSLFASLPLLSPLVNAVAIPWFSWVLVPLALAASLLPLAPLQWLAAAAGEYTLRLVKLVAQAAPEYAVAAAPPLLLPLAVAAALTVLLPRGSGWRPWGWLVLAGFVFYRPSVPQPGRLNVTVWDAGQGLSVWMQTRNHNLLFDTGTETVAAAQILPNLNAAGVRRLDALVLSHHDADHDGGFTALVQAKKPREILAGQPQFYPQAELCREKQWQWDGVYFEWLRPSENKTAQDNDQSCVLRAVAGGQALLVTGDLGRRGERELVEQYGRGLLSQVLVLGHHGSDSSSSGAFLNAVSPQYAVASSGFANAYKHPAAAVQNRVKAHGATLLRTDLSGALVFELGAGEEVFQGRLKKAKFYWEKKPFE